MPSILKQRPVWVYAGAFVLFALCAFAYYFASGDGFAFFVMTAPWGFFLPDSLTESAVWETWVYPISWLFVAFNAVLVGALLHTAFRKRSAEPAT